MKYVTLLCSILMLMLCPAPQSMAQSGDLGGGGPSNDDLNNATVISSLPYTDTGDNTGSGSVKGEMASLCDDDFPTNVDVTSVWYEFTPGVSGAYEVNTVSSNLDTVIGIWTGSGPLTECTCSDDGPDVPSLESVTRLVMEAGITYYIRVAGYDGEEGTYTLNVFGPLASPSNDNLANATIIDQVPFNDSIDNTNASLEKNEALNTDAFGFCDNDATDTDPDFNSVWYSYTPAANGNVTIDLDGSDFDTVMGIWTNGGGPKTFGDGASHPLNEEACNDDLVSPGGPSLIVDFAVTGGMTYYIRIAGYGGDETGGGDLREAAEKTSHKVDKPEKSRSIPVRKALGLLQINLTGPAPLPVELVAFDAHIDQDNVELTWQTASETNNAGFEVQMRTDAEPIFHALDFIDGAGSTTETRSYSYRVNDLDPGSYTFRLKQIDFDGAFEYSPEIEVNIEVPGTHHLSAAYPNPFNPLTSFTLTVAREQPVRIDLFNARGQRIQVIHDGILAAESRHAFTIDARDLPSGTYLYRVTGQNFTDSRQVVLLK